MKRSQHRLGVAPKQPVVRVRRADGSVEDLQAERHFHCKSNDTTPTVLVVVTAAPGWGSLEYASVEEHLAFFRYRGLADATMILPPGGAFQIVRPDAEVEELRAQVAEARRRADDLAALLAMEVKPHGSP